MLKPVLAGAGLVALLGLAACSALQSRSPSSAPPAPFFTRSTAPHQVQVIDDGVAALEKRLEMIEAARTRIDVEYFIYNKDDAAHLFTEALVAKKKANPAITIRILVDASPMVFKFEGAPVHELAKFGISVRYYNKDTGLFGSGRRNHRKLLAVDGANGPAALTGGRNIADEYFDMSSRFNFLDRDVYVEGPAAEGMHTVFDKYWNSGFVKNASTDLPEEPQRNPDDTGSVANENAYMERLKAYRDDLEWARTLSRPGPRYQKLLRQVRAIGKQQLANPESRGECSNLAVVTDQPGFDAAGRYVYASVLGELQRIRSGQTFLLESPYFIPADNNEQALLASLPERDVKVALLTNSLASTDAFYVAAHFVPRQGEYATFGDIYTYSGNAPTYASWLLDEAGKPISKKAIWGIHAKTFVFGSDSFAIGTFNADPRSANINSEMMLYCSGNPALTAYVTKLIRNRMARSDSLMRNGQVNHVVAEHQVGFLKRLGFLFSLLPSTLFESQM